MAPAVVRQVVEAQQADPELCSVLLLPEVELCEDGTVRFRDRLYVLVEESVRRVVLQEAHGSRYSIHPGSTKMYHRLRRQF